MKNEDDLRIRKTKDALKKALLRLVCSKEPGSISITELTTAAGVHRATFYSHYHDIYELYDEVEQDALEKVRVALIEPEFSDRAAIYDTVIDVLQSNADTFMILMRDSSSGSFEEAMVDCFEMSYLQNELTNHRVEAFSEERRFFLTYHVRGCIGMVKKWIREGCRYPKERLGAHMNEADRALHAILEREK